MGCTQSKNTVEQSAHKPEEFVRNQHQEDVDSSPNDSLSSKEYSPPDSVVQPTKTQTIKQIPIQPNPGFVLKSVITDSGKGKSDSIKIFVNVFHHSELKPKEIYHSSLSDVPDKGGSSCPLYSVVICSCHFEKGKYDTVKVGCFICSINILKLPIVSC
jgi:hypothetical protein